MAIFGALSLHPKIPFPAAVVEREVGPHCISLGLFWALLASGQINMRKVDGWQTLSTKPIDQPIDLAA
jgi:hypothetical protein